MKIELNPLRDLVRRYLRQSDRMVWDRFSHFTSPLTTSASHRLTSNQVDAVMTAFLVEDHIPGYAAEYARIFPVHPSVSAEQIAWNREMQHFILRWCSEEDRHAQVLELYLEKSGQVSPEVLRNETVNAGGKVYSAPHSNHFQLFAYTVLQEKATQIFYMSLRREVGDPVLKEILLRLAQDEARHCHFFSEAVKIELRSKDTSAIPLLQETIDCFKMPLANLLDRYKRRSIVMMRAAGGYDYRCAFDHLKKVIEQYASAATSSNSDLWENFLGALPLLP